MVSFAAPKISVVMAYFNRYPQLVTTLDTIAASTHKNVEVIIVDDCSTDGAPIDDLASLYAFTIKVIHMDPAQKTYKNSCVPFNRGFDQATGQLIMLQNPEVCHIGDVLRHAATHIGPKDYYSYACLPLPNYDYNAYVKTMVTHKRPRPSNLNDYSLGIPLTEMVTHVHKVPQPLAWYNNPDKPTYYHFCAVTHALNIRRVRGFSQEYKDGRGFDDNDLVLKMQKVLNLNMVTPPVRECYVIHQYHPPSPSAYCLDFPVDNPARIDYLKNNALFDKIKADYDSKPLLNSIPKIFHAYWDGSPMSHINYLTVKTFHYYNPEYEIIVWTPTVRFNKITWSECFHKAPYTGTDYWPILQAEPYVQIKQLDMAAIGFRNDVSEVFKSDFARMYLLTEYGGLWSDLDIFYVKPLSEMIKARGTDFDTLFVYGVLYFDGQNNNIKHPQSHDGPMSEFWYFPVAFFMATKGNKFFADIYNKSKDFFDPKAYQCLGIPMFQKKYGSGPDAPDRIRAAYPELTICVEPHETYLPIQWYELDDLFKHPCTPIPEISVGIHLCGGADKFKEYTNDPTSPNNGSCMSQLVQKFLALEKGHNLSKPIINLTNYQTIQV